MFISGEIKMLTLRTKGKDYVGFRFRAASKFRFLKCWKDEKNKILMVSAEVGMRKSEDILYITHSFHIYVSFCEREMSLGLIFFFSAK